MKQVRILDHTPSEQVADEALPRCRSFLRTEQLYTYEYRCCPGFTTDEGREGCPLGQCSRDKLISRPVSSVILSLSLLPLQHCSGSGQLSIILHNNILGSLDHHHLHFQTLPQFWITVYISQQYPLSLAHHYQSHSHFPVLDQTTISLCFLVHSMKGFKICDSGAGRSLAQIWIGLLFVSWGGIHSLRVLLCFIFTELFTSGWNLTEVATSLGLTQFVKFLQLSGLESELGAPGMRFTFFAPSNEALRTLDREILTRLVGDRKKLQKFLLFHVASGKLVSSGFHNDQLVKTLSSPHKLRINVDGEQVSDQLQILLQPYQKYHIRQCEELGFS